MKASCKPLFADRTLSTTVPIKVRCSSETDACRSMFVNISCASDLRTPPLEHGLPLKEPVCSSLQSSPDVNRIVRGLHCWPPNPGRRGYHLHVMSSLSSALLADRERPSGTTLHSRPPYWARKLVEAFRSPSSLEEGPPRRRIVEEDGVPDCKIYIPNVTLVMGKERDMLRTPLFNLRFGQRLIPTMELCDNVVFQA